MFTLKITYRPLYIIALYRHRYFTQKLFMRIKKYVQCQKYESFENNGTKMGCIFPMVNSSEFRMRQYSNHDHRQNAATLSIKTRKILNSENIKFFCTIDFSFLNDFLVFAYHTSKW